jgi:murein DD-endopeptidase MepM/ murein hydrolase activator NlpD
MATLGSMKEASDVLNKIADAYSLKDSIGEWTGRFLDDVTINSATIDLEKIKVQDPAEVVALLIAGEAEERYYYTIEGDEIDKICEILGLTEDELKNLYEDYDFDNIAEGDVFEAKFVKPYLRYETAGIEMAKEEIPFDTIEEKSNNLFLGQREVKEEGIPGEREVTRTVTRINGNITSEIEINSEVLLESVPEVVYVGTMMVGSDAYVGPSDGWGGGGNGPLGRPLNGWYLSRSVGNGHAGADMIAPRGSPIFASEHGTVTFAGVYGGYGNLIIVAHGGGLQTYYAHCDTINVGVGQGVARGQQIGTVGSTGRSSAYHLHFEVRVNGEVQEPLNWIG